MTNQENTITTQKRDKRSIWSKLFVSILIVILSIGVPTVFVLCIIETFKTADDAVRAVEPYCSARYKNDVEAYKNCTKCTAGEVLNQLTEEIKAGKPVAGTIPCGIPII